MHILDAFLFFTNGVMYATLSALASATAAADSVMVYILRPDGTVKRRSPGNKPLVLLCMDKQLRNDTLHVLLAQQWVGMEPFCLPTGCGYACFDASGATHIALPSCTPYMCGSRGSLLEVTIDGYGQALQAGFASGNTGARLTLHNH
jgi:hypothetical protein